MRSVARCNRNRSCRYSVSRLHRPCQRCTIGTVELWSVDHGIHQVEVSIIGMEVENTGAGRARMAGVRYFYVYTTRSFGGHFAGFLWLFSSACKTLLWTAIPKFSWP